jgi:hypothetical protein
MATRTAVMEAVEKLNYRVTIGDVAAQSGLDLNTAQREILTLASETGGNIQVAESGEIAYKFATNFRQILVSRSFWLQVKEATKGIWKWLFYAIRISFGILLVVSIIIVVLGIIAATIALNSQKSSNDRDDRRNDDRGGGGFIWLGGWGNPFGNPFIMFDPYYYEPEQVRRRDPDEMGFLESVFSFLFGDGNPNTDLEERRWRDIASMIRSHNGVVIAEQIAPYLDETSRLEGDEYFVIPVLAKFNGFPEVSDAGTLAYKFPELQKVASERKAKTSNSFLQEKIWKFSQASQGKIALSIGLGVFYLAASIVLKYLLLSPKLETIIASGGFLGLVDAGMGFLLGYAILFLSTPLVRYFVLQYLNGGISDRNQKRAANAEKLQKPSSTLLEKLNFARTFATKQEVIDQNNLAYTTEQDLNEQELAKMLRENKDS